MLKYLLLIYVSCLSLFSATISAPNTAQYNAANMTLRPLGLNLVGSNITAVALTSSNSTLLNTTDLKYITMNANRAIMTIARTNSWSTTNKTASGRGATIMGQDAVNNSTVDIIGYNQWPSFHNYDTNEPSLGLVFESNYDTPADTNNWMEFYVQYVPTNGFHYFRPIMSEFSRGSGLPVATHFGAGGNGFEWRIKTDDTGDDQEKTLGKLRGYLNDQFFAIVNSSAGLSTTPQPGVISFWNGSDPTGYNGLEAYLATSGGGGYGVKQFYTIDPALGNIETYFGFRQNTTNWSTNFFAINNNGNTYVRQNLNVQGYIPGSLLIKGTNNVFTSDKAMVYFEVTDPIAANIGPSLGFLANIGNATNNLIAKIFPQRADNIVGSWRGRIDLDVKNVFGTMQTGLSIVGGVSGEPLARVGIGTTNPVSSALFQVDSIVAGTLPAPRMAETQMNAMVSPTDFTLIAQNDGVAGYKFQLNGGWNLIQTNSQQITSLNNATNASSGIFIVTGTNNGALRTIIGDTEIVVANGSGSAGNPTLSLSSAIVRTNLSLTTSGSLTGGGNLSSSRTLSLVNDNATPGNNYFYGTDGSGTKGFYGVTSVAVPLARSVTGVNSITGGGDLSANRTLALVNDNATPGNSKYYGTDGSGTKGFFDLPTGGGGGETNTASNLGSGIGAFNSKSGVDLRFNSFAAGVGITVTSNANTITIANTAASSLGFVNLDLKTVKFPAANAGVFDSSLNYDRILSTNGALSYGIWQMACPPDYNTTQPSGYPKLRILYCTATNSVIGALIHWRSEVMYTPHRGLAPNTDSYDSPDDVYDGPFLNDGSDNNLVYGSFIPMAHMDSFAGGLSSGFLKIRVSRQGSDPSDTYPQSVGVMAVQFIYSR